METVASEPVIDDQTLALKVRNGESAAFVDIYTRYKNGVYLYCTRFLGNSPSAEDIFQEVFMNCYEQLRNGKEIRNIRGYLLSSAHNRCLNALRDRKYPRSLEDVEEFLPAPDENIDDRQSLHAVLLCIPPENREAFILCEYHGYAYEEIAHMTSVPLSTVRKRIFRARQKLRQLLDPNANLP